MTFDALIQKPIHCSGEGMCGQIATRARCGVRICASLLFAACSVFAGCQTNSSPTAEADANVIEQKAEKGPVKLSVQVTPRELRLSDLANMDVTVEFPPEVEIKPPAFGEAVGDFLIRDYSEKPAAAGEQNVRRFHYQLEPAHAGKHLIRSVSIEFRDKRSDAEGRGQPALVETEPIEVNVTSELGDQTPSLANLEPMQSPRPLARAPWAYWLPAAIGAAVVLAALAWWARRRRRRGPVEPPRRSPEEIAEEALRLLLAENLPARGLFKEFYLRLTGIVRQYIEDTTGLKAPEQTTEEFLRDMRAREVFPPARSLRLAEFLEAADMVKYAGQQPREGQIDDAIARAREFVSPVQSPAGLRHGKQQEISYG